MSQRNHRRPWVRVVGESSTTEPLAGDAPLLASSRRSFLKMLSTGAAASLAACSRLPVKEAMPLLIPAEEITPGVAVHYASTCLACPAACGLIATVRDGRPVKLEGDPLHPLSAGGLCAIGQADVRGLYDAGRPRGPAIGTRQVEWSELDRHVLTSLAALAARGGRVAVLTPSLSSPSERAAITSLLARHGGDWVEHDLAVGPSSSVAEAYARLDGHGRVPALHLAATDLWVSLASDELGTGAEPVAHTREWAERRRAESERGRPRHIQVESSVSLTGANADERWQYTAAERTQLALWLLRLVVEARGGEHGQRLAATLAELPAPPGGGERVAGLARELTAAGARALVTSGAANVDEQAAVALLNRWLGAEGTTLDLERPSRVHRGDDRALRSLLDGLVAQRYGALLVVSSDPVGMLPDGAAFATAMAALPLALVVDDRETATTSVASAFAAADHGLERWAEREVRAGVRTLAQPATRRLHDTRDPFECVRRWAGEAAVEGRAVLEASWAARPRTESASVVDSAITGWSSLWSRSVRTAGLGTREAFASVASEVETSPTPVASDDWLRAAATAPALLASDGAVVEIVREVALGDGRHSHLPWLRELPDPLTRSCWTACARIAPAHAQTLGLRDGDVVAVRTESGGVEMPIRIAPGQHPRVIALPLGYGLAAGDPESWNAARLVTWDGGRMRGPTSAARIEVTGARVRLPLMQVEGDTHGRPIVHQLEGATARVEHASHQAESLWPRSAETSPQWQMVIDLDACTGCSACVVACQAENNIPVVGPEEMAKNRDMHWLRIDRYYLGDEAAPDVLFEPMMCSQCGNAPCETVCPVAATVRSTDGLNQQVYNRCVGTRYCANNCPYKVRRFNWFDNAPSDPLERLVLNPDVVVRSRGVMEKCTFCVQRIQAARIESRRDGDSAKFEVTTACAQSCPAQAIRFGDATVIDGEVQRAKHKGNAFQVLAELGTEPGVTYLARRRQRTRTEGTDSGGHGHGEGA